MKTVIEKIKANERLPEILKALTEVDPGEFDGAHLAVNDTDVTQIGILISSRLNIRGVDNTIATGGLVFLYQLVTDSEKRRGLSDELLDDLCIKKSQAYRCVDVWERFGERLINSPKLKSYFVVEALKLLAAPSVCPLAREAAFQMAYDKQKVRIADAEQLIAQFAATEQDVAQEPAKAKSNASVQKNLQSLRGKKSSKPASIWEYAGNAIRFVLRPTQSKQNVDHEAIIKDLETALALYRQEYARTQSKTQELKTADAEVSHV